MRLLLAEDDRIVRITVADALEEAGYQVVSCADGTSALLALERDPFDLMLTDVRLPGVDGLALFRRARQILPDAGIVLMTAYAHAEDAVAVMREGARDYLQKPFEMDELLLRVGRVRDEVAFRERLRDGKAGESGSSILGESAPLRLLRERVEAAAASDVSVLVTGETGTGKEMAARALHMAGPRAHRPLVTVSCSALPEHLLEAELFGHIKGAFTGAINKRIGRFEQADGGSLFLDEIGDMPLDLQVKLLRVLQEREFQRLGSSETIRVDIRVVAASNCDLPEKVRQGKFREDLYYRLNVVPLAMPSLRERLGDVPLLVEHFIEKICWQEGLPRKIIRKETLDRLCSLAWPGNVRQLENAVEMAIALSGDREVLYSSDFPSPPNAPSKPVRTASSLVITIPDHGLDFEETMRNIERNTIDQALRKAGGNKKRAADMLRLKRTTLSAKLRSLATWTACAR